LARCRYGKDKQSGKVAITVCHGGKNEVLSAPGQPSGREMIISVRWMSGDFMRRGARKAKLIVEALGVQKSESGGGLIYQDGKNTSGKRTATQFAFQ